MRKLSTKIFICSLALMLLLGGLVVYAAVYGNRLVDFNSWSAWTVYGTTQVESDFGNKKSVQGGDRLKINANGELRFFLPQGKYGSANAGGIIKSTITGKTDYTMTYKIKFSNNSSVGFICTNSGHGIYLRHSGISHAPFSH